MPQNEQTKNTILSIVRDKNNFTDTNAQLS